MPAFSLARAVNAPRVIANGAAWTVNLANVELACAHLGVTSQVRIIASPFRRGRWGGLHTRMANGVSEIRVHTFASAEEASRILWHELAHAAQHDRGERPNTKRVRAEQGHDAYMAHPAEVEARAAERKHDDLYALTY